MRKKINWGIIGLGNIAHKFTADLKLSDNCHLHGVASRNIHKAKAFSTKFKANKYYGSYEELANDPEIDIVYIATPHTFHFENAMMCLKYNKAVLCEKPMGINSHEVKTMIKEAKSRQLFLMEALWTRFIPATEKLIELLNDKVIGELSFLRADFGFKADMNLKSRLFDKKLGGGSLLDIGIYPIYLSLLTLGLPTDIKAMASMTENYVDASCSVLCIYKNGVKANIKSSIEVELPVEAYIYGNDGIIKLHQPFHSSEKITISKKTRIETLDIKYTGNGYYHEIEEVNKCLFNRETESTKLPHKTTTELIMLIDKIKDEIGLKY